MYAEEWTLARARLRSDMAATQEAIEVTGDAVTVKQAHLKVLELRLARG